MSAKRSKKSAKRAAASSPQPLPATVTPATTPAPDLAAAPAAEPPPPWIASPDPRKRTLGRVVLAGLCVYIAALWLLALDRTFDWGIFGP